MRYEPFWWDEAPRKAPSATPIPDSVDVLIVGSGFSGLCAARVLANAGKSVLVCESGQIGCGASTRNGGMLGPSFHTLGVKGLQAHYGKERTLALLRESIGYVDFVRQLVDEEKIDCEFQRSGRFRCASSLRHYDSMARENEALARATGVEAEAIPKHRVREEIGSDRFYGGVRYKIDGGLHPAKYHDGLVRVTVAAGTTIAAHTEVTGIKKTSQGYAVTTRRGVVTAEKVAICTNGYTTRNFQWFRRRVLPIRSSIIATEPLPEALMRELMPTQRMYGDSRRIHAYYRPSPDGRRIIFGGRATSRDLPEKNAILLRRSLLDIFPQLEKTRITHSWSGLVAYAFDHVPHTGRQDGLFYSMGYCGSGVARASFLGTRLGYKMLDMKEEGRTAFDDLPFDSRPLYTGNPWFMPAIIRWHRLIDESGL